MKIKNIKRVLQIVLFGLIGVFISFWNIHYIQDLHREIFGKHVIDVGPFIFLSDGLTVILYESVVLVGGMCFIISIPVTISILVCSTGISIIKNKDIRKHVFEIMPLMILLFNVVIPIYVIAMAIFIKSMFILSDIISKKFDVPIFVIYIPILLFLFYIKIPENKKNGGK